MSPDVPPKTHTKRAALTLTVALVAVAGVAHAVTPNVKGRIIGQEKLIPDVYVEAAKPDAHRWTWREPSAAVQSQFRVLAGNPSRDLCIAAVASAGAGAQDPILMTVTGGRIVPTTIVVSPGTRLSFKNFDPFIHRIYLVGQKSFAAADQNGNAQRDWSAPNGSGRFEFRDELFPSIRTFVVVDPQVVQVAYPGRDGSFGLSLAAGDYVLKAFFNGKQVGKPIPVAAKEKTVFDLKDPMNVSEGADAK